MPEVTITLKTIDEASKPAKTVKKEFEGLVPGLEKAGKGVADFVGKNATLIAAVGGTIAVLKSSYDEYQKYAGAVRDVALASGTTAEESSRLLQVLDDYQISAQDVTAATRAMTKEGLTPTIDTLAQLSDQYLSITDAQERNEFVIKNLGRAGLQWVNVLQQGGDTLRDQSKEISKNLILTDDQIKKAERQRLAVDAVSDAWQGFKVQLGSAVGEMILAVEEMGKVTDRTEEAAELLGVMPRHMGAMTDEVIALSKQLERGEAMTEFYKNQLKATSDVVTGEVIPSQEELQKAIEATTQKNQDYLSMIGEVSDETENYHDGMKELDTQYGKEVDALKKLTQTRGWDVDAIEEQQEKIDGLKQKMIEEADTFEQSSRRRMLAGIEENLAMDGLTEDETRRLEELGVAWGIYTEEAISQAQKERQAIDLIAQGINNLPDGKNINVILNAIANIPQGAMAGNVQALPGGYGYAAANQGNKNKPHATGGAFVVPSAYGNEGFPMGSGATASGGETVTVTQQGKDIIDYKRMAKEFARAIRTEMLQVS